MWQLVERENPNYTYDNNGNVLGNLTVNNSRGVRIFDNDSEIPLAPESYYLEQVVKHQNYYEANHKPYVEPTKEEKIDRIVRQEIYACVSSLIYELCRNEAYLDSDELMSVLCQDDWEEPARYRIDNMSRAERIAIAQEQGHEYAASHPDTILFEVVEDFARKDWQEFCESESLDPHVCEALEHWIVSDWLADKLLAQGEMVTKDFLGLTIWGRTCSGQSITLDGVMGRIVDATERDYKALKAELAANNG